jgi:hypothetical protein
MSGYALSRCPCTPHHPLQNMPEILKLPLSNLFTSIFYCLTSFIIVNLGYYYLSKNLPRLIHSNAPIGNIIKKIVIAALNFAEPAGV